MDELVSDAMNGFPKKIHTVSWPGKRVLWLLFIIVMLALTVFFYYQWCQKRRIQITRFKKTVNIADVKSGDLCLSRFLGANCSTNEELLSRMSGPSWSHVGLFHRDLHTGQLFLFELSGNDGVQYSTMENRMQYYAGHIAVRHLHNPLTQPQLDELQRLVDETMLEENHVGDSVEVSTFRRDRRRVVDFDPAKPLVNYDYEATQASAFLEACGLPRLKRPVSAVCTDFVRTVLERISVLCVVDVYGYGTPLRTTCLHPDFFITDRQINELYGPVMALKNFYKEHDTSVNHCIFDDTRKVRWINPKG